MQCVHRAHFLDELVKLVPAQRAHFNKRVDSIEDYDEALSMLHFKDGSTTTAKAVIGADAIHSHVREHLVEKEAAAPVFAQSVAYRRALVPMDVAIDKVGATYAGNSHLLCGAGKHCAMHVRTTILALFVDRS